MKILTILRNLPKAIWRFVIPIPPPPHEQTTHLVVEPNSRGGWSIRIEGDQQQLGNYPTAADALRIARYSYENVRLSTVDSTEVRPRATKRTPETMEAVP